MARYIEITLKKRGISCVARLLDEKAPRTCEAVWNALPQEGEVYHAKYASNEIYILVPAFAPEEPGPENCSMVPAAGDVMYFTLESGLHLPVRSESGSSGHRSGRVLRPGQSAPLAENGTDARKRLRHHHQEPGRHTRRGQQRLARRGGGRDSGLQPAGERDALRAWGIEP